MVMLFHYIPGNTILHRLDIRIKLIICIISGFFILNGNILVLCIISVLIISALFISSVPMLYLIKELRGFFIFLFFIFFTSSLTTPGTIVLGFKNIQFGFTLEGLFSGAVFVWKFLLIILLGCSLTFTSSFTDFRYAVLWFLKPFPFVNARLVSTMVSLILRFVPEILNKAEEISIAHKSRRINARKNPFIKILSFSRSLMYKTFLRADEITLAMKARCYSTENASSES